MRRLGLIVLLTALALLPSCGCIPEQDPNLSEKTRQCRPKGCSPYGVSPVVPYKIEGGSGWR